MERGAPARHSTPAESLDFFGPLKKQHKRKRKDEDTAGPHGEGSDGPGNSGQTKKKANKRTRQEGEPSEQDKPASERDETQREVVEQEGQASVPEVALFGRSELNKPEAKKHKKAKSDRHKASNSKKRLLQRGAPVSSRCVRVQAQAARKAHKIKVKGGDVPPPISSFASLGDSMRKYLLRNIEEAGYTTPTPIQMQAIPILLAERELMAIAPTGSHFAPPCHGSRLVTPALTTAVQVRARQLHICCQFSVS